MTRTAQLLFGVLALPFVVLVAGCTYQAVPDPAVSAKDAEFLAVVATADIDPDFHRYRVDDPTGQDPGTIVVDTQHRYLYLVEPNKKAIRYGVAVGSEAYGWTGTARVARMAEWPRWVPPADMVERWPHLRPTLAAGGVEGGPDNPLGARALYLYQGDKDTLYRIHGTNEPSKIGRSVSSGCIRMTDIDVIDLYNRVKVGAKVIVM
ncbi:L,D-transpeptidase [Methylocapsa acidiphila]|uniref:L,D-transpeptidase n=1 Tax=Methylocapsa acidiphila TaxID=133552 RepID=UPI0004089B4D|nr:L,D-transpeptidase [Methylocapsa acidiphila]